MVLDLGEDTFIIGAHIDLQLSVPHTDTVTSHGVLTLVSITTLGI